MKQLTQILKNGKMDVLEVPTPTVEEGKVLVQNYFSVISAGTEGKTVSDARAGYLAKAQSRKKELMAIIDMAKTQGLWNTYKVVMNKLEAPVTLGYSSAGRVIAVGKDVLGINVGDYVACAGLEASHSEVVLIPKNLCVKVNKPELLNECAFVALGAIAMQGIRRANVQMGENVLVIGLGTIGLLTIQMLNVCGCKSFGIDIDDWAVKKAKENGAYLALNRHHAGIEDLFKEQTNGHGFDAVIITAGSSSLDPVNFAGRVSRKKGKIVIVGAVPTGFEREPYYRKELDLLISTSYGPGRYDKMYEEKGQDYPIGYVRWTEQRNMQSFVELVENRKIELNKVISHIFELDNAPEAYDLILTRKEKFSGILIQYSSKVNVSSTIVISQNKKRIASANVAFIGAGSFAQNTLLPYLKNKANLIGVSTTHGNTAYYVAKKFGFRFATTDTEEIFQNREVDTVFIATRHNTHAHYVIKALEAQKHVFVEKPLCLTLEELNQIKQTYLANQHLHLLVGFNRRFSPFTKKILTMFHCRQKKAIQIRINAGFIPSDHWIQDPNIGGGRIVGEVCHFVDLAMYLAQSPIEKVTAWCVEDSQSLNDNIHVQLTFNNGSIASIAYLSNGSKCIPKEYIEIFSDGNSIIINDFKKMIMASSSTKKFSLWNQDKGHENEVHQFLDSLKTGKPVMTFEEIENVMKATFAIIESINQKTTIHL